MTRFVFVTLLALFPLSYGQDTPGVRDLRVDNGLTQHGLQSTRMPRGYALVVGVSVYRNLDPSQNLRFPESDADAVYRALISQEGGAFPAENVHFLKGSDATLARMRHELETWLPSVAQPEDRVVVYFAGHGMVVKGRGYLLPWDVEPERAEMTAYSMQTLGEVLAKRINAHWKVLLTAACHSGKINPETNNQSIDDSLRRLPHDFLTFTATTAREQSYEDPKLSTGFGLFSYFLVQAWKGNADADPCDGVITADELIEYVRNQVKRYAREHGLSQTPTPSGDYAPNMPLGMSRGCLGTAAAAPSMLGTAVVETNMDGVEVYLDGAFVGRISAAHAPLVIPGLASGPHKVDGLREGYEPDHKEVLIAPGQESSVSLRFRYPKVVKKNALELGRKGEKLLFSHRSSLNLLRIEGIQSSRQSEADLRAAESIFVQALKEDPDFSKGAFDLGQTRQLLSDERGAMEAYRRAIRIDPGYVDARLQYAAVLIENGDADEAIRQLLEAVRLESSSSEAHSMLARAYWDKGAWTNAVAMADKAISFSPAGDQAYLWKADATRQLAAIEKDPALRSSLYLSARDNYKNFLSRTNFSTPAYDWLAFHFIGFGLGSRRHADRLPAYDALRNAGYLGLCLCDQRLGNPQQAKEHCERALKYAPADPITYFELGNVFRDLFNNTRRCEHLSAARRNYARMLKLNRDLSESKNARDYIEQIDVIMRPGKSCS